MEIYLKNPHGIQNKITMYVRLPHDSVGKSNEYHIQILLIELLKTKIDTVLIDVRGKITEILSKSSMKKSLGLSYHLQLFVR